jgi:hypothetical protein
MKPLPARTGRQPKAIQTRLRENRRPVALCARGFAAVLAVGPLTAGLPAPG